MSKYSSFFLLSSPEYEKLGDKLRLRKYGSWLAEEAWLREEQSQKRALFTLKAIDLARKIAKEKGIEDAEAFEMLQSSGMVDEELMGGYGSHGEHAIQSQPVGAARDDILSQQGRSAARQEVGAHGRLDR